MQRGAITLPRFYEKGDARKRIYVRFGDWRGTGKGGKLNHMFLFLPGGAQVRRIVARPARK